MVTATTKVDHLQQMVSHELLELSVQASIAHITKYIQLQIHTRILWCKFIPSSFPSQAHHIFRNFWTRNPNAIQKAVGLDGQITMARDQTPCQDKTADSLVKESCKFAAGSHMYPGRHSAAPPAIVRAHWSPLGFRHTDSTGPGHS